MSHSPEATAQKTASKGVNTIKNSTVVNQTGKKLNTLSKDTYSVSKEAAKTITEPKILNQTQDVMIYQMPPLV